MFIPYAPLPPTKEELLKRLHGKEAEADERMRLTALNYAARVRTETDGTAAEMLADAEAIYLYLKGQS